MLTGGYHGIRRSGAEGMTGESDCTGAGSDRFIGLSNRGGEYMLCEGRVEEC